MEIDDNQNEDNNYFQTIGSRKSSKPTKIKPNLPKWINESINYCGDIQQNSIDLNEIDFVLDECILNNLRKNGIEKLFPVQKQIIPKLIDSIQKRKYFRPNDICIISPTGSGKTYAYCIPIIQSLINRLVTQIRVLIILPVQDLANQVYKVFQSLCANTTLRVALATSSSAATSSSFYKTNGAGKTHCLIDILIATPGKLIDLIENSNNDGDEKFHLQNLEILIIDEADRMMNETQLQWLAIIEKSLYGSSKKFHCPCSSSSLIDNVDPYCICSKFEENSRKYLFKILFSATMSTDPEKIDSLSLYNPILINMTNNVDDNQTNESYKQVSLPNNLKELMVINDQDKKPLILWYLIRNLNYKRILCFTNSIINTHRLGRLMKHLPEINVQELHSKQNIHKRTKILKKFENGQIDILISTDVTARGIDIDGIDCVVSYDLPRNETAYIHRIGRTARAGKQGTTITLLTPDQLKHFNIIIRRSHQRRKQDKSTTTNGMDESEIIEKLNIKNSDLKPLMKMYRNALKLLKNETKIEQRIDENIKQKQLNNKLSF